MKLLYRPEIDGLRAIAVLAVVAYHAELGGAGFVGVDVFFVISGYLITSLLLKEQAETGRIDLLAFYARRVRRIFPAAIVLVLAVLGLSAALLDGQALADVASSAGASSLFAANFHFQSVTGGYWSADSHQMPLLHLWSLAVEEQFYLVWPALLIFLPRIRVRAMLVALALASLALAEWWVHEDPNAAFYQMPARFWELAAGGLIATSPQKSLPRSASMVGVLAVLAACIVPMPTFPGIGALPGVLGAMLIVAAAHGGGTNALLRSRPMVAIGLISYSLYLWHWPLLALYRATSVGDGSRQVRLVLVAVAFVAAFASYRYIEQPFRKTRFSPRRTVVAGVVASLLLSASAFGFRPNIPPSLFPDRRCHSRSDEPAALKCEPGRAKVAVWGDSMAYAWSPEFPVSFSRDACAPLLGYVPKRGPGRETCRDFNDEAIERLRTLDAVYLSARWSASIEDPDLLPGLRRSLDALSRVRRVVIIGPTPEMADEAPRCVEQHVDCGMRRADFDAVSRRVMATLRHAAYNHPNVSILDMTDRFCDATRCPPELHGKLLYWDRDHVVSGSVAPIVDGQ